MNGSTKALRQAETARFEYGPDYYKTYGLSPGGYSRENPQWLDFFGYIADQIVRQLNPRTALDVGCAKGFLVECLRDRGVDAYGYDVSEYAISEVRDDIKPYCWVASAANPITRDYDLITCIEVCEHLQESEACEALRQMTSHSETVLFSSTPSEFTDPTHVNVRPIIDWLRLFAEFGFAPDEKFDAGFIAPQAMLLRRAETRPADETLRRFANVKNQAVASAEVAALREELKAKEATLHAIVNSRGWKLLSRYRDLRFRVKHPIAQAIRTLKAGRHLSYERWIRRIEKPACDYRQIARDIDGFCYKPTISLIMPVYSTPAGLLDSAIRSVQVQHYKNWELCICDDASPDSRTKECLEKWRRQDERIRMTFSNRNDGIVGASNRALGLASGKFVGLLDHDDELAPHALYEVVKLLQVHRDADMIYSDEDKLDAAGRRAEPFFKPDWSPEYILSCMYTCHFGVYRKSLLDEIGGFRSGFDGSQDYDLVLRMSDKTNRIYHIPKILYHWRVAPGSAAASTGAKPYAYIAAKRALSEHLQRRQIPGDITDGNWPGHYKVRFHLNKPERVSIIIPATAKSEAFERCVESIQRKTAYPDYEIIVVNNEKTEGEDKQHSASNSHKVLHFGGRFDSSRMINFAAKHAAGAYLLLLHEDVEVSSPDWINAMVGFCQHERIGAVGAKLLYRNERIEHAGIALGLNGVSGRPLRNFPKDTPLGFGVASDTRNCAAVSAACMMMRTSVFDKVGGFDERLSIYNDVDFCLKIREAGYRIVWTPWAELYHDGSSCAPPSKRSRELSSLRKRWGDMLFNDPYYNPNLTLRHEDLGYRI